MNKIIAELKRLWARPLVKTIIVTAAGGAFGAITPMLAAGTFVLNSTTASTAVAGALSALGGLYIHKPKFEEPKP